MPTHRVVIIGASTTGLFAAAAAAGSGRSVTVLERDDLPSVPVARPGVPQGRQPHVFLHRGLLAAEQLLPGFRDDLLAVGAVAFDTADMAWLGEQGWANRTGRSFEVSSTSRPLLETTLRRRVVELTGVQVVGGRPVVGLDAAGLDAAGTRWTVRTADRGEFGADLVIDASGRNSRIAAWLGNRLAGPVRGRTMAVDHVRGYTGNTVILGAVDRELRSLAVGNSRTIGAVFSTRAPWPRRGRGNGIRKPSMARRAGPARRQTLFRALAVHPTWTTPPDRESAPRGGGGGGASPVC